MRKESNTQEGGNIAVKKKHSGKGILSKPEFIYAMMRRYYGCEKKGKPCTEFGDFNDHYTQIARDNIFNQKGGADEQKYTLKDPDGPTEGRWRLGNHSPGNDLGLRTLPTDFKSKSTLQHEKNLEFTDYELPKHTAIQ